MFEESNLDCSMALDNCQTFRAVFGALFLITIVRSEQLDIGEIVLEERKNLDYVRQFVEDMETQLNRLVEQVECIVGAQDFKPCPLSQHSNERPATLLPPSFTPGAVQAAFQRAEKIVEEQKTSITSRRRTLDPRRNIPSFRHQMFNAGRSRSRTLSSKQDIFEEATRVLQTDFNLTPEQVIYGLQETDLESMLPGNRVQDCKSLFNFPNCRPGDRFRTFDGTCNNLQHHSWGMASCCFQRLLDPVYADGISQKRVAVSGNPLPSPRRLSLELHPHLDNPTDCITHMFVAFGQFLDHDILLSPLSVGPNNEFLDCCPQSDNDPAQCDPIILENDDPFYSKFGINCLSNTRSMMCSSCTLGPREQINQLTAYIDASHIYGLNVNDSKALRNNDGTGTLRSKDYAGAGELPPGSAIPLADQCSFQDPNLDCFETGDLRCNQHPALTSLHIIFLREHNRIARRLKKVNRNWDDERLYQESRRIVGALMQLVTYSEFLPLVLGPERMEWYDLTVCPSGFSRYDETVEATIVNEFSTAALRFGHSVVNSFFATGGGGDRLSDIFLFPFAVYRGALEGLMLDLTESPAQKFDRYMVPDVTNHLFQCRGNDSGLDLASLNINRGRDHGIPGYTQLVEFCGGPVITRWSQLDRLFQKGLRQQFQTLYEDVADIDLFSGGLAERPNQGALVGPTFTCIIGKQFYHLKYGDRFYFEHEGQVGSFSAAQLGEIKKMTLGKIVCQNSGIKKIQPYIMRFASRKNPVTACEDLPEMNLNVWRQR